MIRDRYDGGTSYETSITEKYPVTKGLAYFMSRAQPTTDLLALGILVEVVTPLKPSERNIIISYGVLPWRSNRPVASNDKRSAVYL